MSIVDITILQNYGIDLPTVFLKNDPHFLEMVYGSQKVWWSWPLSNASLELLHFCLRFSSDLYWKLN